MGDKKEKRLSRTKLADYLEDLSRQLRIGRLEAEGRTWTIPKSLDTKIQFKEKKGRISAKLSWHWNTLRDYDEASREEVTRWKTSFKTLKKRLTTSFKKLKDVARKGDFPDKQRLEEFQGLCTAFSKMAEPEWEEAMKEFMDHLKNLQRAIENKQLEIMRHEIRDLENRMRECHRAFK
jgi:XXXCH domain-containing protein